MTGALRRLAALAAALAPDRAERLLLQVAGEGAPAAALAAALARGGREERLAAVAAALAEEEGSLPAPPAPAPAHALLRRLACEERASASRRG
jgi:hypothetical protein